MTPRSRRHIASKNNDQYLLKLPPGIRGKLNELADNSGRSVNTEIVVAVERHLQIGDSELAQMRKRLLIIERKLERHLAEGDIRSDIGDISDIDSDMTIRDIG